MRAFFCRIPSDVVFGLARERALQSNPSLSGNSYSTATLPNPLSTAQVTGIYRLPGGMPGEGADLEQAGQAKRVGQGRGGV